MEDVVTIDRGRVLARVLGAVALTVLLAGAAPWGLVTVARARFGGAAPWSGVAPPGTWDLATVTDALTSRLTDELLADLLLRAALVVAWTAVIVVVVTVAVEVVHQVRHDGIGLPDVRGLGWGQPLARYVASGLIMVTALFGHARVAAAPLPLAERPVGIEVVTGVASDAVHVGADVGERQETGAPEADGAARPGSVAYVVEPGDSVWAIAERLAGPDPARVAETAERILDDNLGRAMPGGARFVNAAYIEPGWILQVPETGHRSGSPVEPTAAPAGDAQADVLVEVHVVEPGDTLSGIASAHLDAPDRWPEIFELNAGRTMPDGRRFTDPHLIHPGWEIELPDRDPLLDLGVDDGPDPGDGLDADPLPEPDAAPDDALDAEPDPEPDSEPDPEPAAEPDPALDPALDPATGVELEPADGLHEVVEPAASFDPEHDRERASGHDPGDDPGHDPGHDPGGDPGHDPGGDVDPAPGGSIGLGGAAMLSAGLVALLAALRARQLRSARPSARLPEPRAVAVVTERAIRSVDADERLLRLDLALRAVAAEVADRDRQVRAALVGADGAVEVALSAPCQLELPWVGATTRWTLPGDVSVDELAATARSVGAPCVALVQLGVADDDRDVFVDLEAVGVLAVEGPDADRTAVCAAIAATLGSSPLAEVAHFVGVGVDTARFLDHPHAESAESLDDAIDAARRLAGTMPSTGDSTFALRARGLGGETWEPTVVVADSEHVALEPVALEIGVGRGLAVVTTHPVVDAGARLVRGSDSWRLTIGRHDDPDDPDGVDVVLTPVMLAPDESAALADLVSAARVTDGEPVAVAIDDGWREGSAWAGPDEAELPGRPDVGANGHDPVHTAGDEAVPIPSPEPEWSIMVRLVGPVDVVALDGTIAEFEKSKARELVAWLATHRERSTRTAARTALWDLDVRDATFANVVSAARRTLARLVEPPAGDEWVARTQTERLPLHAGVVTDADVIEARLAAARGRPPAEAVELLAPAVELVRGMPFEGTSYLWPDAEGLTSRLVVLATSVTSALAEHLLALGDVAGVLAATGRGLRVLPGHEELIGLRMRAHASTGDPAGVRAEWESYERVVTGDPWSDGEPAPRLVALRDGLLRPGSPVV